ncbi:reverse transcriptase domain-containing protein, partial [Dyella sp.]|uniref:reverse transcriptase domain-containing protein n=1 Tax=Dyella sp. TaxID=1869338 RepID=UPI00283B9144
MDDHPGGDSEGNTPVPDETTRAVLRAVRTVRAGGPKALQRAVKSLSQGALASINDTVLEKLRALHPPAGPSLPEMPVDRSPGIVSMDQTQLFRLLSRRVNNGSAAGPSGWTGAHLQLIAQNASPEAQDGLTMLIKDIGNATFGGHMRQRLLASLLLSIEKRDGGVRPIACGEVFTKLAAHYQMHLIEDQLPSLFPRIQFGVRKPGGSESAAQLARAMIDQCRSVHIDTIALQTDFINAFNNADRAQMWETLMRHDEVAPILRMFHWAYAEESPLLVYERSRLKAILASAQGVRQGDPFAAFVFALLVQTLYEKAIAGHPDCHAVSVLDDLTLVGPLDQVMRAYDYIALHAEEYHLQLRVDKCSVYVPPTDDLPPATRHSIEHACTSRQLRCLDRLELLGVTLGTAEDIHSHLTRSIDQHQKLFEYLHHPAMPTQIGFALLRYCALPRLSYLARTTLPEHMLRSEMAPRFDSMVIDCYHRIMGTTEEMSDRHVLEQIQLPIKRGGMGLRPVARTCHSAYFASLASIMTEFVQAFPATENHR